MVGLFARLQLLPSFLLCTIFFLIEPLDVVDVLFKSSDERAVFYFILVDFNFVADRSAVKLVFMAEFLERFCDSHEDGEDVEQLHVILILLPERERDLGVDGQKLNQTVKSGSLLYLSPMWIVDPFKFFVVLISHMDHRFSDRCFSPNQFDQSGDNINAEIFDHVV